MKLNELINKKVLISYHKNMMGENAKILDIGKGEYKVEYERFPDEEEPVILQDKDWDKDGYYYHEDLRRMYIKENKENNENMKTTVKELSQKLGVDPVYVNGFLQTLIKLGKASIVGRVEKPEGGRGKPSNIYEIEEGIVQ